MKLKYLKSLFCCLLTISVFSNEQKPQDDLFLSTPEQVATLSCEPSYLVGGVINPLSGQIALRQTDLVVKGAQNIVLCRTYIPPHMPCSFAREKKHQGEFEKKYLCEYLRSTYKGWQFYPHLRLELNTKSMEARVVDASGMTLDFRISGSGTYLASSPYAMSNVAGEIPSGKNDPRNIKISYEDGGNRITVQTMDGTLRIYQNKGRKLYAPDILLFSLEKEILPNGKVLRYYYKEGIHVTKIESLDPEERYVYASISVEGRSWDGKCHFTASSGLFVDYNYQQRMFKWDLDVKKGRERNSEKGRVFTPPILTSVSSPSYRHETLDYCPQNILSVYSGKNETFSAFNTGYGEGVKHYRVQKLFFPVGQNDSAVPVHEFSYQPAIPGQKEGTTTVKNSDGTSIVYHFSKNLLTTLIQYVGQDGQVKREKFFSWTEKNWLKSLEIRDGQKRLLYRKSYEYDNFGNPILENLTGDLSGGNREESYTTKRTFSQDGKNLLLKEETEDGKVVSCTYFLNTNLLTSKLTKDHNKIILRDFYLYDDSYNLIQKISDDGFSENKDNLSGVQQRTITTYKLRQSAPFLHMPEWVEETYWESGVSKSLRKSHLIYDQHGNVAQEEVFDANEAHAYTIIKTYNERGDVLSETNRLGQKATYTFNEKGKPITATNFSNRLCKKFVHDAKGRRREMIEQGDDKITHTTKYDYDFHDRLIHKQDSFQNSTHYTYDPIVNEIIKTESPPIASVEGRATPVSTSSSYDPFGREITKTDANGHTTSYRYNAYGSPVEILHANGGKESFRYAKNGMLISYTDLDGRIIEYQRDILGRALSKTYIANGKKVAEESFTYNGFNLLTETDKEGQTRTYSYDGAGRKVREEFCGRSIDYSYDSLGFLKTSRHENGKNTLLVYYTRDLEGRVLQEEKTDLSGRTLYKIAYAYDEDGNQAVFTRVINGKKAVETFSFDSCKRLIEKRDAEGFATRITYNENWANQLGQKVLLISTTDPRNITSVQTQDALARTVKKELLNPQGSVISCQEWTYDLQGNLLFQRDHVYENAQFQKTQAIAYTYTTDHHIATLTRAFGTSDARTTIYSYLLSGKMATKTLPDGVTLHYSYNALGFMSRLDSSNGKIYHVFDYNRLGHLLSTLDENQKLAIRRDIDPFGNVTREIFPSGLEIRKEYDAFNRLICLKMAEEGDVVYSYDPLFLREVKRYSPRGEQLYSHAYTHYDESGYLINESLLGGLGQINHLMSGRGQKLGISSPYFSQQCQYDPVGNLINLTTDQTQQQYSYDGLSQLTEEKGSINCAYSHDSVNNRTRRDGKTAKINDLNELASAESTAFKYDLNGNLVLKQNPSDTYQYGYDPLNRLIEVSSGKTRVHFTYDPLGRRLSKIVHTLTDQGWKETCNENYLYDGQNEIGAFAEKNTLKNLRVFGHTERKGIPTTVGVEISNQFFAPIIDVQGNIRALIAPSTKALANRYEFTSFGEDINVQSESSNPWRYASKRYDAELGLIYFGKRYYDPKYGRWLTTDPAGFVDSSNLYQYALNNPFKYYDPNGESLGGFLLGIGQMVLGGALIVTGTAIEIITVGGYTIGFAFQTEAGCALIASGFATAYGNSKDLSWNKHIHSKRHTPDQEALSELVKEFGKKGVSNPNADTLLDWAKEYDFPNRDDRGKPHWDAKDGMDHIHLGPKHIPIIN